MFKFRKKIFWITSISFVLNFFITNSLIASTSYSYTPLEPIGSGTVKTTSVNFTNSSSDFSNYINTLYKITVGVAGVLAVLMIMWGGIEYMSTDAIGGKEEAKGKINNALLGLFIALGSYLLLQTINKQLLSTNLQISEVSAPELEIQKLTQLEINTPNTDAENEEEKKINSSKANDEITVTDADVGDGGKRILTKAVAAAGDGDEAIVTKNVEGTKCGRVGCAYAGSKILERAGYDGYEGMMGTAQIDNKLKTDSRFNYVGSDINKIKPGDIVMAVTEGNKIGHFTVSTGTGSNANLAGNSSSAGRVQIGWRANDFQSYESKNGLPVKIYRAK